MALSKRDLGIQVVADSTQALSAVERIERGLASMGVSAGSAATAVESAQSKIDASLRAAAGTAVETSRTQIAAGDALVAASTKQHAQTQSMLAATATRTKALGDSLRGLSLPIAAIGGGAAKLAIDFSRAMSQVHTQAGYSQASVDALSKSVLDLAPKVGVGPVQLAQGLFHIASAGIPASQAMGVLEEAAKGAAIGGTDLEGVTNALVGVLKSAPKDIHGTADAMGLLNSIAAQGNMHMADLVTALGTGVVPAAKGAGLGLRDLGAAIDVLTDRGVPAVDAATQLKMSFAQMERETPTATKALASIGIGSGQLAADLRKPNGLLRAVDDLKMHLEASGKSATEQNATILAVFGRRSAAAMQSLVQNAAALADKQKGLPGATEGVTKLQQAFADWEKTPAAQWEKNLAGLKTDGIELGNNILPVLLPLVKDIAGGVGAASKAFSGLPKPVRDGAVALAALVAVAGPALIFTSKMATAFGSLGGLVKSALVKMGVIATGEAAAEGTAAGTAYGEAFDAAAAAAIGAGAAGGAAAGAAVGTGETLVAGGVLGTALKKLGTGLLGTLETLLSKGGGKLLKVGGPIGATIGALLFPDSTATGKGDILSGSQLAPSKGKFGGFATGSLQYEGLDQGIDFTGTGSLRAPADIKITRVDRNSGWPGGTLIAGQITSGKNKGRYVYFAEALKPGQGVSVGNTIAAGSEIASLSSSYPGSESGFAQNAQGQAYGNPSEGKNGANPDPQAIAFADFLAGTSSVGAAGGTRGGYGASSSPLRPCLLTYYDPRQGGINVADPKHPFDLANGGQWTPSMMGCAAPPSYKFGALIEFHWKGKTVTCTVVDRGGAIQGAHFDLQPAPAQKLGMMSAGAVNGQFRVVTAGSGVTAPGANTSAKQQSADFANYQSATSDVQLKLQAGTLTSRQAQSQLRTLASKAISGGFGSLDSHMLLQAQADLHAAAPSGSDVLYGLESKAQRGTLSSQKAAASAQSKLVAAFAAQIAPFTANQQRIEAKQNLIPTDLSTYAGAHRAIGDLQERKGAQQHIKQIYESELKAIQKEVAAWVISRDTYRKLARKAKGAAKKQALDRAAGLQAMIDQASADAQTVGGNIADAQIQIQSLDDQIAQTQTDATTQQQGRAMADYQQAISDVQLQADAGLMTQAEADAKKQQIGKAALAISATFGTLSQRDQWQIMADLNAATQSNTAALNANTQATLDATNVQLQYAQAAQKISELQLGEVAKALTDMVDGQITGLNYAGRRMSAGSGAATIY